MSKPTVVKHNSLIEAQYETPHLSKAHGRVLAFLVSQVHSQKDEDFKYTEILPEEYRELTGNSSYNLRDVERDLGYLTRLTCRIETKSKTAFCHLVDYAEVEHSTGLVKMRLGKEMKPYLLRLHSNYTMYYLEEYLQLGSKHSQRLYEIFQKEKNQKNSMEIEHSLDDLKRMLGLVEVNRKGDVTGLQYSRWDNFENRVLLPSREELCEIGILFEYEPIIERRKTVGVRLFFNPTAGSLDEQTFQEYGILKNLPIPSIAKVDISRSRSRSEIQSALMKDLTWGAENKPPKEFRNDKSKADYLKKAYKNILLLVPKSRSERITLLAKKVAGEKVKVKNIVEENSLLF